MRRRGQPLGRRALAAALSRREVLALGGLAAALGWYTQRAPELARDMVEARARANISVQPFHLVAACLRVEPSALPSGPEAARAAALLREALALDAARSQWARRAMSALSDAQVAVARAGTAGRQLPKSRAHRNLPTEMLRMEEILAQRFGSTPAPELPEPDLKRWSGATPMAIQRGLLSLLERGAPPLSEQQARAFMAALLSGLSAHEALPDTVERLREALGEEVLIEATRLARQPLNADQVLRQAGRAITLLEHR